MDTEFGLSNKLVFRGTLLVGQGTGTTTKTISCGLCTFQIMERIRKNLDFVKLTNYD